MKLSILLKDLCFSELGSAYLTSEGELIPDTVPKLVSCVSQSLQELHTKFRLRERTLHILCLGHKTNYEIRKEFATTDPTPMVPKYILDTQENPFTGDLIQILSVSDALGNKAIFGDSNKYNSLFIPRFDTIQVNFPQNNLLLEVTYQASHPILNTDCGGCVSAVLDQNISISPLLHEALRVRIASRFFSSMSGKEYTNKSAQLDAKFEMLCAEAEQRNLLNGSSFTTTCKLESRGFV